MIVNFIELQTFFFIRDTKQYCLNDEPLKYPLQIDTIINSFLYGFSHIVRKIFSFAKKIIHNLFLSHLQRNSI